MAQFSQGYTSTYKSSPLYRRDHERALHHHRNGNGILGDNFFKPRPLSYVTAHSSTQSSLLTGLYCGIEDALSGHPGCILARCCMQGQEFLFSNGTYDKAIFGAAARICEETKVTRLSLICRQQNCAGFIISV